MKIVLPIRRLVDFILKSGSINSASGKAERAAEGSRIHRRLQKAAGKGYEAEVVLSAERESGGIVYQLQGRADGIFQEDGITVVDEIKTTETPLEQIEESFCPAHWAQGCCYAQIVCAQRGLSEACVRLTYYQVDTGEIKRFQKRFTSQELDEQLESLLLRYKRWAAMQIEWRAQRGQSLRELAFPFETYRAGQRRLAAAVYRTVQQGGRLFCSAPTGIGKTVSTIFPALKAMGEEMGDTLFYLTAKTVTRRAAEDAIARMREKSPQLRLKTITITAKDKMCFLAERSCTPEACPYAADYFDRVNDTVYSLLQENDDFTREAIEAAAKKAVLCPYELSLDLSQWCDVIICDYNYLFDPTVHLQRFFDSRSGDYLFLIDEAHNLVDRSREMFSASLAKGAFLQLNKALPKAHKKLRAAVSLVNSTLLALRRDCESAGGAEAREQCPEQLEMPLRRFAAAAEEWLGEHRGHPQEQDVLALFFNVRFFLKILETYDERYITFLHAFGAELSVRLFCLDPAPDLDSALKKGRAAVLFSATLSPMDYYREVLGGREESKSLALPSPFEPSRLGLFCVPLSTRYNDREQSVVPIARLLAQFVSARAGHYIAYFPSYAYLERVLERFVKEYPQIETAVQGRRMDDASREAFLSQFEQTDGKTLLGFCVLGGIYSEGVDLTGEKLIGAAVVGVGLPQIGQELNTLRAYFDKMNGLGFEFAYQYPGMNKVMQAAGRVIRTERDVGAVLLIDDRFLSSRYRQLMPPQWSGLQQTSAEQLSCRLQEFWGQFENEDGNFKSPTQTEAVNPVDPCLLKKEQPKNDY